MINNKYKVDDQVFFLKDDCSFKIGTIKEINLSECGLTYLINVNRFTNLITEEKEIFGLVNEECGYFSSCEAETSTRTNIKNMATNYDNEIVKYTREMKTKLLNKIKEYLKKKKMIIKND